MNDNQTSPALDLNPEANMALRFIKETQASVFLTGKAGTGKTTLLRRIQEDPPKRLVVTAPTGVAAINARGVTLHAFFQLPFGPYIPNDPLYGKPTPIRMNAEKLAIIKSLDLLIIDEISMVRADTLDRVDMVLRQLRGVDYPFGGVQLLMIGDLHQLSPVVKSEEQSLLRQHYNTPYFFSARVFHTLPFTTLTLKKIYRQQDDVFIQLLNEVRNNSLSVTSLAQLNERYCPPEALPQDRQIITLTTHNRTANRINDARLDALKGRTKTFTATVKDNYPNHAFPAPETLSLKVGAQVMFVRNDNSGEKRYYNGKIGLVKSFDTDSIRVRCEEDNTTLDIERSKWENIVYTLDPETQNIETTVEGTFEQYPLRLAWAITIHKSQGLTFKDVIIDAEAAFAHGQVYVALSRCQSLEGIILQSPIVPQAVRTDGNVNNFSRLREENPSESELNQAKDTYQKKLIAECFAFSKLLYTLQRLCTHLNTQGDNIQIISKSSLEDIMHKANTEVHQVALRFAQQVARLYQTGQLPETDPKVQERIQKACVYFGDQLISIDQWLTNLSIDTDNKEIKLQWQKNKKQLAIVLGTHLACLKACEKGFETENYLQARATAPLKIAKASGKASSAGKVESQAEYLNSQIKHPKLYEQLKDWRKQIADKQSAKPNQIMHQKLLVQVAVALPTTQKVLRSLQGFSKNKVGLYGSTITKMVKEYCNTNKVTPPTEAELLAEHPLLNQMESSDKAGSKNKKIGTREQTLHILQQGKSISEIAEVRSLTAATIKGHVAHYIEKGKLELKDYMEAPDMAKIMLAFENEPDKSLSELKEVLKNAYDYGDLNMVKAHLSQLEKTATES